MTREGMKRLDIWLPYNHPIWDYPPGLRARKAREWLDIAAMLETRLARLEEKIEAVLEHGIAGTGNSSGQSAVETETPINPDLFLDL
ncbi:hypothetical protein MTHERMOG20_23500 [Moorella thermoacetica]|uniref:hypothetical protein n=1 Tax=Neomoorella TaxID=44260 RepID=UPI0000541B9B|nr:MULTISPECIES: hypothetical protein [Moorella]AKX95738.1 hypothetical protein MOTHA_c03690 [Moorella thermoacetica]OIQ54572.1 hypothetical protein MOCA_22410 [Moorella thermoacetica]QCZ99548.1 hypothetical protein MothHH_00378 [Moorella thermoacetica]TYL07207.1 hypothetical protein MOOCA_23150 [Moorella thermoacetica]TYL07574.1 hypothetical protein MOLA_22350 [Moorella thermoacetica]